jgi:hypothetical protein
MTPITPQSQSPRNPIADLLAATRLGPRQAAKALTLFPIQLREGAEPPRAPAYVSLASAFAKGLVVVDEVSEGGSVPNVRVTNRGETAVLFLFGEEIRGAKQNRVANASFLVAPGSSVALDVSCVEAGRWGRSPGARFAASEEIVSNSLRKKMAFKVAQARRFGRGFRADQGEVWSEIGARIRFARAEAPTSAYADYRASRSRDVEEIEKAFRPIERQVGFVAAIGDEVVGMEAIGSPRVFAESFRALVRGYAIDAVDAAFVRARDTAPAGGRPRFDAPEPFLAAVSGARLDAEASLGLGQDLRLEDAEVAGCALACGGLVHATAFPQA